MSSPPRICHELQFHSALEKYDTWKYTYIVLNRLINLALIGVSDSTELVLSASANAWARSLA